MINRDAAGRLQQLWRALTARVTPEEDRLVSQALPPAEYQLYRRMPLRDRRHCLDVYATLVAAGTADPFVLRAALFHDTGKVDPQGQPVPLLWYGGCVILKRCWPRLFAVLAASPQSWRRPIYYYAHHARLGADLAAAAGSPAEIVEILRHYHDDQPPGRARVLQWADRQH